MSKKTVEIDFDRVVYSTYALSKEPGLNPISDQALAHKIDFGFTTEWVPASQVEIDEESKIVEMPEWLAIDKGLI